MHAAHDITLLFQISRKVFAGRLSDLSRRLLLQPCCGIIDEESGTTANTAAAAAAAARACPTEVAPACPGVRPRGDIRYGCACNARSSTTRGPRQDHANSSRPLRSLCKGALQFIRLFRYACPFSSFRCSRKRPSLLSLACASGRLSFAVGERYYCVYFLSAISFHVRTYAHASFHITIQTRSTNTIFTYVQSSTLFRSFHLAFVY